MYYSIQPRDICKIYIKGYGFLSFAKILPNSRNLFDSAKNSSTEAIETAPNKAFQKAAISTVDSIGNKIANKTTKSSQNNSKADENELEIPKERYISPEKRQKIIDELRLT